MIFAEKKVATGYTYEVDDAFGYMKITSTTKLDGPKLDDMVVLLMHQGGSAEVVEGTVEHDAGTVEYYYKKRPIWSKEDEEICDLNTHTSTQKQANVSTVIPRWLVNIYAWCRKFVVAFRKAWKNASDQK